MRVRRYYVYKCVVDDGGAPCVDNGLLSLTICKPYIRSTARPGDWIFAFGSNAESPANRLIYIAEVKQRLTGGSYFEREEFQGRQDCIYQRTPARRLERRKDALFHDFPAARKSDLGAETTYPKANALVADEFRYFGRAGTAKWKAACPVLCAMVENLGQGHRVNFTPELLAELQNLKNQVWDQYPHKKNLGLPLHAAHRLTAVEDDELVKVCGRRCFYVPKKCD